MPIKCYPFTFREVVAPEISAKSLGFFDKGLTQYLMFPEERHLPKKQKAWENY